MALSVAYFADGLPQNTPSESDFNPVCLFSQCYFVMSNCTCVQVNKLLLSFLML